MRKKIVCMLLCMFLVVASLPMLTIAGDEDNPELRDKTRDVFSYFGVVLQALCKHIDVQSAWFYEDPEHPENLYVSLKLRDLKEQTTLLEAIYGVDWVFDYNTYSTLVHIHPDGIGVYFVGKSVDGDEEWDTCDGEIDVENHIITWSVPKSAIGNPQPHDRLLDIFASTVLRFTEDSGMPMMDLFKDLSWNAKTRKDYSIQY